MSFGFPLFLLALGTLLLPIAIHLIRFRSFKTLHFSDTRFLKSIRKETSWRNKLKEFILLALRLLALALLVIAFSKPFENSTEDSLTSKKSFWIYLDNSFSMSVIDGESTHFQLIKSKIQRWIDQLPKDSEIVLLTNDNVLVNKLSPTMASDLLIDVNLSLTKAFTLTDLLKKYKTEATSDPFYIVSDFQSVFMQELNSSDTLPKSFFLVPTDVPDYSQNVSIDSAWFDSPIVLQEMDVELWVRLRNHGSEEQSLPLNLVVGMANLATKTVTIPANTYMDVSLQLTMGNERSGKILIDDRQAEFDNAYYFSLPNSPTFSVCIWDEGNQDFPWDKVYTKDHFELELFSKSSSNFELLESADLIILADWNLDNQGIMNLIQKQWENGKSVVIFPDMSGKIPPFVSNSELEIDSGSFASTQINGKHRIFSKVFQDLPEKPNLPKVNKRILLNTNSGQAILSFNDNWPLFLEVSSNNKPIYVFTSRLQKEWGSLRNSELLIPIFINAAFETVRYGSIQMVPEIGSKQYLKFALLEGEALKATKDGNSFLPIQNSKNGLTSIEFSTEMNTAGHYALSYDLDTVGSIALNILKEESDLTRFDFTLSENLEDNVLDIESMAQNLNSESSSSSLWKLFAWLGFVFLVIESLVSKFAFRRKTSHP